ncbi:23S rRNA (adenine(2503)-C(2))-methyltransferase RlmN [Thermosediminibacter oceani]|uniref:Probable dual-specificity RNA methyltransferase RlmN n=1 Tax=Thermosediminibacter oceani (strain ATCC BAA-1034 / DSM 16646 / JW/IW-1228P) TaxID=555079 RepID=D9S315_THEOJ|nr:23S rRNA (adenine(2503)-C(2))-methyltransferase RlmN [Thermosediminibacter oceani]ADL07792.1 23S rRNA m(2)A-2503 methyltransferase [Thermosediminibacter oceani DSM 16646]
MAKTNLKGMTVEELQDFIVSLGEPPYRARQIFRWIYKGVTDFEKMTDLPRTLVEKLKELSYIDKIGIYKKFQSRKDATVKYLFLLSDNNIIESVKMEHSYGVSVCVSSQVGCAMGCAFCASTIDGLKRSLNSGEMVDQILVIQEDIKKRISHVVIMGSGEPLLNYDELIKFLNIINSPLAFNISYRRITVSTCGIVPEIRRLADEGLPITLSVSLHAPEDDLRDKLVPVNRRYPILELLDACKYYIIKTNRRITFEYALISDVNDSKECAVKLARLLKGLLCHVNLIPLNPVRERDFMRSKPENIRLFQEILRHYGISVTVRQEMGADIEAACGQLRRSIMNEVKR